MAELEVKVEGEMRASGVRRDREEEDSFLDWNGKATLFDDEPDEDLEDTELAEDEELDELD